VKENIDHIDRKNSSEMENRTFFKEIELEISLTVVGLNV
jgi:hypothetical protein